MLKYLKAFRKYDKIDTISLQDSVKFYPEMHRSALVFGQYALEIPKYLYTVHVINVTKNALSKSCNRKSKDIVRSINTHRPSNLTMLEYRTYSVQNCCGNYGKNVKILENSKVKRKKEIITTFFF